MRPEWEYRQKIRGWWRAWHRSDNPKRDALLAKQFPDEIQVREVLK